MFYIRTEKLHACMYRLDLDPRLSSQEAEAGKTPADHASDLSRATIGRASLGGCSCGAAPDSEGIDEGEDLW